LIKAYGLGNKQWNAIMRGMPAGARTFDKLVVVVLQ